ncbi:MAG: hypothetical protein OXI73_00785 [Rhodospirillales bacterium]|nr:hypothetical protein [Rhodospirillales bacterium]
MTNEVGYMYILLQQPDLLLPPDCRAPRFLGGYARWLACWPVAGVEKALSEDGDDRQTDHSFAS